MLKRHGVTFPAEGISRRGVTDGRRVETSHRARAAHAFRCVSGYAARRVAHMVRFRNRVPPVGCTRGGAKSAWKRHGVTLPRRASLVCCTGAPGQRRSHCTWSNLVRARNPLGWRSNCPHRFSSINNNAVGWPLTSVPLPEMEVIVFPVLRHHPRSGNRDFAIFFLSERYGVIVHSRQCDRVPQWRARVWVFFPVCTSRRTQRESACRQHQCLSELTFPAARSLGRRESDSWAAARLSSLTY